MSKRIVDETTTSSVASDDYLIMDGSTNGSRKITPDNLVANTTTASNLTQHISDANDAIADIQTDIATNVEAISTNTSAISALESDVETLISYVSKNLLSYPYTETTHTENGITWTDNEDGTVTADGTATADSIFYLTAPLESSTLRTYGASYTLSLGVDGESTTTYFANGVFSNSDKSSYTYCHSATDIYAQEYTFSTSTQGDGYFGAFYIRIKSGVTVSSLTFYPMLRYSCVSDDTFFMYGEESVIPYLADTLETEISGASTLLGSGVVE